MKKVVLITGAAGGIGAATVAAFAPDWTVVAADREQANRLPGGVLFRQVDLAEDSQVQDLFQWVEDGQGRLDALVNNAAVQIRKPLTDTTFDEWNGVLGSNLGSIFLTTRYANPLLQANQGAIVNIGSVHAIATSSGSAAYAASKGGVLALTRACALELAPVRVNAILPGAIDTAMLRSNAGEDSIEESLDALGVRTALGRIGNPEEVAQAILFLADGSRSSFVTGSALVVDGGALARLSTEQ